MTRELPVRIVAPVRLGDVLPSFVHNVRGQGFRRIEQVDEIERLDLRACIAEAVAGELAQAFAEQLLHVANYRLGSEDVRFARAWARWLRWVHDDEVWCSVPIHAAVAAELAASNGAITDSTSITARELIGTRPKRPHGDAVSLKQAPAEWPTQILSWQAAIGQIIGARWEAATGRPSREPGDDGDD